MALPEIYSPARPTIRVVDVSHHYGVKPVLSRLSFDVLPGELVILMGPNGAGKSTLLSIVAGLMSPAKGFVEINGLRRRTSEEAELRIRRQMAFLPDHPWLPDFKTGCEWLNDIGDLYDVESDLLIDHIARLLDLFQLTGQGDAPIRTYSNGQKKKLAICAVLVTDAPILILDEPFTGGLDPAAMLALGRVLQRLCQDEQRTIFMASQLAEMMEPLARRIAVLEDTRLKAYDTLEGLRAQTGCAGPLAEVFEKLVHPKTAEQIENYFQRPKK